ncbi:thermonuclease family protein [Rufibacter roseus]|uniref:Thermonuclease family protein n=1 Tax=Rufibacter roseus TaxID=1567108 RepID=A0ABW2DR86_9BACT|nr:thermonuclease family protein [Rufibacter roseus]
MTSPFNTTLSFYLALCLLIFSGCQQSQQANEKQEITQEQEGRYKVIAVKDGDTIELLKDGIPLRVRLQGVDTPEKRQDFGTRAQQFTAELVFGKFVELVVHDTDRYGRTVGEIILEDGRNLGYELIKNGFAWHYTAYSKDPELARLEAEARADKRGLWDHPNPVAPWDFRRPKKGETAGSAAAPSVPKTAASSGASISNKNGKAFFCESKGAKTYHLSQNCQRLQQCKSSIGSTSLAQVKKTERTPCKVCAD